MLDKLLKNVESVSKNALSMLDNPYVSTFVKVFLVVYAGVWAPRLPPTLAGLFQNNMFRMLVFFLVVFVATKDARIALLIAVGFLMSMQALSLVNLPQLPAPKPEAAPEAEPEAEAEAEAEESDVPALPEDDAPESGDSQEVSGFGGLVSGANY